MRWRVIVIAFLLAVVLGTAMGWRLSASAAADDESGSDSTPTPTATPTLRAPPTAPAITPGDVPSATVTNSEGGRTRHFIVALDEIATRLPSGKSVVQKIAPQAGVRELKSLVRSMPKSTADEIRPVVYEMTEDGLASEPRFVSHEIRVEITAGKALAGSLPDVVEVRQLDYAPEYAVVEMSDSFAAMEQVEAMRHLPHVKSAEVLLAKQQSKKAMPNDPMIGQQWHLKNTAMAGTDINVEAAWNYPGVGYRGAGVVVGVVDDGLQTNHPDLAANVRTDIDYDWNDGTPLDPSPALDDDHGTACAGNVAAVGNNALGVCGSAPEAGIAGLRLIAGATTDAQEAEAMAYLKDVIHVKSNSWGPSDSGTVLEAPGVLTRAALKSAAETGRGGRGSIFLWAGGNGLAAGDNSNYDGYANSIYTIAVGALTDQQQQAYYSESGANLVVVAPSSGGTRGIVTTDRTGSAGYAAGDYDTGFGGTSSSTPTAAGVVALILQRNPNLGWRDVKEILIRSALKVRPEDPDWVTNPAGFHFNHKFGAGLVDATAAVDLAATWTNLGTPATTVSAQSGLSVPIPDRNATGVTRTFNVSSELRVEHVTVRVTINHSSRGNLAITLTSPGGVSSRLSEVHDDSGNNYPDWTFSTVRNWGETATGNWTLKIADQSGSGNRGGGTLTAAELTIHGANAAPTNQPPVVTAAVIAPAPQAFADQALQVTGVNASDPEGGEVVLSYQWQSSTDGILFGDVAGQTAASLAASASNAGQIWRCQLIPQDGEVSGDAFTTGPTRVLTRPPTEATRGTGYQYAADLVLRGNGNAFLRGAIVNEFSQGPSGGAAEWVELLVLQNTSLVGWKLQDSPATLARLTFAEHPLWANLVPGTLIVIYNGASKDPLLPADDLDAADGVVVVASSNASLFSGSWPALADSGDPLLLEHAGTSIVHQLSYGSSSGYPPNIGSVESGRGAAFVGDMEEAAATASGWRGHSAAEMGSADVAGVTPGTGNTTENMAFVASLRSGFYHQPTLFRLGAGAQLPTGLTLSAAGLLEGTIIGATGNYPIVLEAYNQWEETAQLSYTLTVLPGPLTYAQWAATFPALSDSAGTADPDGDGRSNRLEYFQGSDPLLADNGEAPIMGEPDGADFVLRYRKAKDVTGVTETVDWSGDLENWAGDGIVYDADEDRGDHWIRTARKPMGIEPQMFLRLTVE